MVPMQTQPAPPQSDPTAVMGRRIVAFLIDYAIAIALGLVLFFVIAESADLGSSSAASSICEVVRDDSSSNFCLNVGSTVYVTESSDSLTIFGIVMAYWFFFTGLLPGVSGYSLGKAVMGLRVIRQSDGQFAGAGYSLVRWIIGIVELFFCFLIGLITAFASKGHRRLGDMAASTLVVDKSQVGIAPNVPGVTSPQAPAQDWSPPPPAVPQPDGSWSTPAASPQPPAEPPAFPPPGGPAEEPPPAFPAPTTPPVTSTGYPPPGAEEPTTAMPSVGADEPTTSMDETVTQFPEPSAPVPQEPSPTEAETSVDEPAPAETEAPEPAAEPADAAQQAGVDAPVWDDARNTYIQWDPELGQWMEWSESQGRWVPIST